MSGLTKPHHISHKKIISVSTTELSPIDPTLELSQPGGPYPPGYAILTDGLGGFIFESTLRPYFLSFALRGDVPAGSTVWLEHHGIATNICGPVLMLPVNLIGISLSVDLSQSKSDKCRCEVLARTGEVTQPLADLLLINGRSTFRRDLCVDIEAGAEIVVKLSRGGRKMSILRSCIVMLEFEN